MRARSAAVLAATAALIAPLAAAVTPAAATSARPSFVTTLLAGTSGRSEPRVAVAPDGTRYVDTNATNGTEVVFASRDGRSWKRTPGVPVGQTAATTDVDIVATQSGRLVASELDDAGINFITAYSDDKGATWKQTVGQTFADTDRQWFTVGPVDPQTHQSRVYLLFHNLLSGALSHNMFVATSTDGGATFGPPIPVATPPQKDWLDLQCADSGGPSNIFYDKKTDRVFVVFGTRSSPVGGCAAQPPEINVVAANRVWVVSAPALSTSLPTSWTPHLAVDDTGVGGAPSHIVGMQLAPGASDTAGNVYVAYPESVHDYPNYDGGAIKVVHAAAADLDHWSQPTTVAAAGGPGNVLPHVVAGAPGKVDVAWYHGVRTAKGLAWYSTAAQSLDALSAAPHWAGVRLSPVDAEPSQTASELMGACLQGQQATLNGFACNRAADVYGIALDRCGSLIVTWPAQARLASDGTYVSQQVGGPTLGLCRAAGTVRRASAGSTARPAAPASPGLASPGLASSGLSPYGAVVGLGLLAGAAALLRRLRVPR